MNSCGSLGSSPHTRGARLMLSTLNLRQWIIPAYAGSTSSNTASCRRARDHPRIRGEHYLRRHKGEKHAGSSPHTRGARPVGQRPRRDPRIIPAYAGSTRRPESATGCVPDHPRIRGEHVFREIWLCLQSGSSPHTRGAHSEAPGRGETPGIIPAYAGSTKSLLAEGRGAGDHPRIRGEHTLRLLYIQSSLGSSPHTRGAPVVVNIIDWSGRIIPAYAGSTAAG